MEIVYGLIGLFILIVLLKILSIPFSIIKWFIANGLTGLIILYLFDFFASGYGYSIEINLINSLIVGALGIPGIIILLLFK